MLVLQAILFLVMCSQRKGTVTEVTHTQCTQFVRPSKGEGVVLQIVLAEIHQGL